MLFFFLSFLFFLFSPHHFRFVLSSQPTLASRTFLPPHRFPVSSSRLGDEVEIGAAGLAAVEEVARKVASTRGAALLIDYGTNHPNRNTLQAVAKHQFKNVLEEPGKVDLTTLVDFKSIRATVQRTNGQNTNERERRRQNNTRRRDIIRNETHLPCLTFTPNLFLLSLSVVLPLLCVCLFSASLSSPLHVFPLITQSHLLRNLNISGRLERLVNDAITQSQNNQTQAQSHSHSLDANGIQTLIANAIRMVDPDRSNGGMGAHFKAMCFVSNDLSHAEIVPFNIPDELMKAEDAQFESKKGRPVHAHSTPIMPTAAGDTTIHTAPDNNATPNQQHIYSTHTPNTPTPTPTQSTSSTVAATSSHIVPPGASSPSASDPNPATATVTVNVTGGGSSLASRIDARRAAARAAAEQLAQARAKRQQKE